MGKRDNRTLIAGIVCTTLAALLAYQFGHLLPLLPRRPEHQKPDREKIAMPDGQSGRSGERTLREREGWVPQDFFEVPDAIRACKAITSRDQQQLQALIDAGLDVNLSGKAGITLLYWAFVSDNLEAFKLLLESGADPDQKLTNSLYLRTVMAFREGDSILFTTMRITWNRGQLDFFYAALDHASEKDPRDAAGNTLLHVVMAERRPDEAILARIIEFGVDLDAQTKYGNTEAMWAVSHDRPDLALQMFEAGADPSIRNNQGQSVADLLRRKLEQERGNQYYPKEAAQQLLEWLEKRDPPTDK